MSFMPDNFKLQIRELLPENSDELASLMAGTEKEYSKHFIPFNFEKATIRKILNLANKDKYFGIFFQDEIAGFYMLRGFDEGYDIPSYGVWISPKYSGKGLAGLTIAHAISYCKILGVKGILLKVHPDNNSAKHIYEKAGFKEFGIDEKIGHIKYYKSLE